MSTVVDIGTLIERSPEIRKGRPCIAGTGVSVRRIAGWYNLGLTPEEIAAKIEHLSLAQIHAALTYYHANRTRLRFVRCFGDRALAKSAPVLRSRKCGRTTPAARLSRRRDFPDAVPAPPPEVFWTKARLLEIRPR